MCERFVACFLCVKFAIFVASGIRSGNELAGLERLSALYGKGLVLSAVFRISSHLALMLSTQYLTFSTQCRILRHRILGGLGWASQIAHLCVFI